MNRVGKHRDAVPADLVAEVLAGDADGRAQMVLFTVGESGNPYDDGAIRDILCDNNTHKRTFSHF